MNPTYTEFKFPQIRPYPWNKIFKPRAPAEAIDLIARLLCYVPTQRLSALEACAHPFFDELRDPRTRLPNDQPLPPLFDWSDDELASATPELRDILMPPFARPPNWSAGAPGTGTLRPPVMRAAAPAVATSPYEPDSPSGSRGVRDSGTSAEAMRAAAVAAVGAGAAATAAASGSFRLPAVAADKSAATSQKLGR
jgi:serine/threonine protein kinase